MKECLEDLERETHRRIEDGKDMGCVVIEVDGQRLMAISGKRAWSSLSGAKLALRRGYTYELDEYRRRRVEYYKSIDHETPSTTAHKDVEKLYQQYLTTRVVFKQL